MTIIFVSALHIFYSKPSSDPIFPADTPRFVGDDSKPWYYKSDPRARAFACIDRHELCSPDGKICWSMIETGGVDLPPDYWLMKLSLFKSNVYDSIAKRLGSALIAQDKVSQFTSEALDDKHWMKEAERLFATSLARTQFDAWSIASGEDWIHEGNDGYVNLTPDEAGNLCGIFKFNSTVYRNVKFWPFFGLLWVLPVAWFLSLKNSTVIRAFGNTLYFRRYARPAVDSSLLPQSNEQASATDAPPTHGDQLGNGTEGERDGLINEDLLVFHSVFMLSGVLIRKLCWDIPIWVYRKIT